MRTTEKGCFKVDCHESDGVTMFGFVASHEATRNEAGFAMDESLAERAFLQTSCLSLMQRTWKATSQQPEISEPVPGSANPAGQSCSVPRSLL